MSPLVLALALALATLGVATMMKRGIRRSY